jgi:hypothetical protein
VLPVNKEVTAGYSDKVQQITGLTPDADNIFTNLKPGGYYTYHHVSRSEIALCAQTVFFVFCVDLRTNSKFCATPY